MGIPVKLEPLVVVILSDMQEEICLVCQKPSIQMDDGGVVEKGLAEVNAAAILAHTVSCLVHTYIFILLFPKIERAGRGTQFDRSIIGRDRERERERLKLTKELPCSGIWCTQEYLGSLYEHLRVKRGRQDEKRSQSQKKVDSVECQLPTNFGWIFFFLPLLLEESFRVFPFLCFTYRVLYFTLQWIAFMAGTFELMEGWQ